MKSWLALDLAISLSNGIPFLDYPSTRAINVLYIQKEDPKVVVRQRHAVIASSKAPNHVPGGLLTPQKRNLITLIQTPFSASDEGWQAWLSTAVEHHKIELVIFDTLSTVANGIDIDKANEVKRKMIDPIKVIAREHNCAMLFVHHNTKSGTHERSGQNMSGSGQIHAWADFGLYAKEKTNDNKLTFDVETKFTGTVRLTYHLAGLDNDPQEWLPREILRDESAGSGKTLDSTPMTKKAMRTAAQRKVDKDKRRSERASARKAIVFDALRRGVTDATELCNLAHEGRDNVNSYIREYKSLK